MTEFQLPFQTVRDLKPNGSETALLRTDFSVPITAEGQILDDFRIQGSVPTLKYLLDEHGSSVVICSHLGRPKGGNQPDLSLRPIAEHLSGLLDRDVQFISEVIGHEVHKATRNLSPGSIVLLENLRFHKAELENDAHFATALARSSSADYFVQDGFSVAHREQASTVAITHNLPSVAGLLVESEYSQVSQAMEAPDRPLVVVMGGAKVSDKLPLITRFIEKADRIIIGGAMANTFLAYKGHDMADSFLESGMEAVMEQIYAAAAKRVGEAAVDDFIVLPEDVAVDVGDGARQEYSVADIPANARALDIGSHATARTVELLGSSGTVIWNGPVGLVEKPPFTTGSRAIARHIFEHPNLTAIAGGGDTSNFIRHLSGGYEPGFNLLARGGGATLALMSGEPLPGLDALLKAQ